MKRGSLVMTEHEKRIQQLEQDNKEMLEMLKRCVYIAEKEGYGDFARELIGVVTKIESRNKEGGQVIREWVNIPTMSGQVGNVKVSILNGELSVILPAPDSTLKAGSVICVLPEDYRPKQKSTPIKDSAGRELVVYEDGHVVYEGQDALIAKIESQKEGG